MLQYDGIDISEGSDINKTSASKECDICYYWYFFNKNFSYEPYICNGCYDLMQKPMDFNDVSVVSIKKNDYRIHFWYVSKNWLNMKKLDHYKLFFAIYKRSVKQLTIKEIEM